MRVYRALQGTSSGLQGTDPVISRLLTATFVRRRMKTKTKVRAKVEEGMKVERSRSRITRY
jgi:hypothetical protein